MTTLQKYLLEKKKHPCKLLFVRQQGKLIAYSRDAVTISRFLHIGIESSRPQSTGFAEPYSTHYLGRLNHLGYDIAICEQL